MLFLRHAYEMALASSISPDQGLHWPQSKQIKKGQPKPCSREDRMGSRFGYCAIRIHPGRDRITAARGGAGITEALNPYFQKKFRVIEKNFAEVLSLATLIIPLSSFTIIFAELIPKIYAIKND